MPIQDFATAQQECRLCLTKCKAELDGLLTLTDQAPQFTAGAFAQSVNDRLPQIKAHWQSSLARLSILVQVMNEVECESETLYEICSKVRPGS